MPHASVSRRIGRATAAIATVAIVVGTLTPVRMPQPLPFETRCYFCGDVGGVDVLLNLLIFLPFGLGLYLSGWRTRRVVFTAFLLSATVETLQYCVVVGRDASLSDLTNNTLGALLGCLLAPRLRSLVLPGPTAARRLALAAVAGVVAVFAGTALLLRPAFAADTVVQLRGQGALYGYFQGRVLSGRFAGVPVAPTAADPYGPSPAVPVTLGAGAPMGGDAIVTAGGPTPGTASIGGVFERGKRSQIFLGQWRRAAVFRVRLRATRAKLRTPIVVLPDVFPADPSTGGTRGLAALGDTLQVGGALAGDQLTVTAERGGARWRSTLVLSPFMGWALLLFWEPALGATARAAADAAWTGGLLALVGYWSARTVAWASARRAERAMAIALPAAAIVAGVWGVPALLARTPAPWWVWLGAVTGAVLGLAVGRLTFLSWKAQTAVSATAPANGVTRDAGDRLAPNPRGGR